MERKCLFSSSFWDLELGSSEEYLMMCYYSTNHYISLCGAYHLPYRRIMSDIMLPLDIIKAVNRRLEDAGHLIYIDSINYVINPYLLLWQNLSNSKILKGIKIQYEKLPIEAREGLESMRILTETLKIIRVIDDSSMSHNESSPNHNSNSNSNHNNNNNSNSNHNSESDDSPGEIEEELEEERRIIESEKFKTDERKETGHLVRKELDDLFVKMLDIGIEKQKSSQLLQELGADKCYTILDYVAKEGKSNPCALFLKCADNYMLTTKKLPVHCETCKAGKIEDYSPVSLEDERDLEFYRLKYVQIDCPDCVSPESIKKYKKVLTEKNLISKYHYYHDNYGGEKWIDF